MRPTWLAGYFLVRRPARPASIDCPLETGSRDRSFGPPRRLLCPRHPPSRQWCLGEGEPGKGCRWKWELPSRERQGEERRAPMAVRVAKWGSEPRDSPGPTTRATQPIRSPIAKPRCFEDSYFASQFPFTSVACGRPAKAAPKGSYRKKTTRHQGHSWHCKNAGIGAWSVRDSHGGTRGGERLSFSESSLENGISVPQCLGEILRSTGEPVTLTEARRGEAARDPFDRVGRGGNRARL